jgi:hypothetical protein
VQHSVTDIETFRHQHSGRPTLRSFSSSLILDQQNHSLIEPWIALQDFQSMKKRQSFQTYNSWIILSKLMTANKRDAIAAPEISARATIRSNDAMFLTVEGAISTGETVDMAL